MRYRVTYKLYITKENWTDCHKDFDDIFEAKKFARNLEGNIGDVKIWELFIDYSDD